MKSNNINYYEILELDKEASNEDIKKAYRRLVKVHHPDTGGSSEKFNLITEAYNILSDPSERDRYDRNLLGINNMASFESYIKNATNSFNKNYTNVSYTFYHDNQFQFRRARKLNPNIQTAISINMNSAYVGFSSVIKFDRHLECEGCNGMGVDSKNGICQKCHGVGSFQEVGSATITIPPRTISGHHVVIQEAGNIMSDGRKGVLDVSVQYTTKSEGVLCSIDGTLYKDIMVPWDMALLEEKFNFTVFQNCTESVSIKLDSAIKNGGAQRLKGLGMANKDLIIKVWYLLPSNLNSNDRKLIAKAIRDVKP